MSGISETSGADYDVRPTSSTPAGATPALVDDIGVGPIDVYEEKAAVDGSVTDLSANIKIDGLSRESRGRRRIQSHSCLEKELVVRSWSTGSPYWSRSTAATPTKDMEWIVFDLVTDYPPERTGGAAVQPDISRATDTTVDWGSAELGQMGVGGRRPQQYRRGHMAGRRRWSQLHSHHRGTEGRDQASHRYQGGRQWQVPSRTPATRNG